MADDEDNIMELVLRWPLKFVDESEDYECGWCGQGLLRDESLLEDPLAHFKSCKNTEENGLLVTLKELPKFDPKYKISRSEISEIQKKADNPKNESQEEKNEDRKAKILILKTEIQKEIAREILDFKMECMKEMESKLENVIENNIGQLKKSGEMREKAISTLFKKINILEEKMNEKAREMDAAQTLKMENVVHSVEEIKEKNEEDKQSTMSTLSAQLAQSQMQNETMAIELRNTQILKTQLEQEVADLKTKTESVSEQLNESKRNIQNLQTKLKVKFALNELKNQVTKKKICSPFPFPQIKHPLLMNEFNLATQNYQFVPSFRLTINGIKAKLSQKTFHVTSEMFQWNGYAVRCRAKFHVKTNDWVYMSLCLDDAGVESVALIPKVYYLLRCQPGMGVPPRHRCRSTSYLFGNANTASLTHGAYLSSAISLILAPYNAHDSTKIEVYVEPSAMAEQVYSYDGTLNWVVENYSKRWELEAEHHVPYQTSPYFYTSSNGYRVQVRLSFRNGPMVEVLFLTGKFDAGLARSFAHRTTLTLINPRDPERSLVKTTERDIQERLHYDIQMCSLDELESHVVNDALFLKINIESL